MRARILARCVHGMEWVAAEEITRRLPLARPLELARRQVAFDLPALGAALLDLRTVDDVFVVVGEFDGVGTSKGAPALIARHLTDLPFTTWMDAVREIRPLSDRPRFDIVASMEGRRNYSRFVVEGLAGRALAPLLSGRFLERTPQGRQGGEPDLTVRLFLRGATMSAALRLADRPLHRRGYKEYTAAGTLHPPLAAALGRIAGPLVPGALLDPFCGDGTIVIEALAEPRRVRGRANLVVGSDLDLGRLANTRRNASLAGVDPLLVVTDAAALPLRQGCIAAVVTNPPWNLAVDARGELTGSLIPFWRRLPTVLAQGCRIATVTDEGVDAPSTLRHLGYPIGLETRIRVAGRVSHVVLCAPPGEAAPMLDEELARWRSRAIATGVVTEHGF